MNASAKLGIALIVIFATCILALIVELVYVLWRKRSFSQRSAISGGARSIDSEFSNSPFDAAPSKELLYFFCWKNQPARVEPSSGGVSRTPTEAATAADSDAAAVEEDDELAKWQELYGQFRVLYTIKEEEREGTDTVENPTDHRGEAKSENRLCLRDCFSGGAESADDEAVAVDVAETPFSTPCASPPYFTPSPSPDRDVGLSIFSPEGDDVSSPDNDVLTDRKLGFVSLTIKG